MWQGQFPRSQRDIVVVDQVEIERARTPAPFLATIATVFLLDLVQDGEERVRRKVGPDLDTGIDKPGLPLASPWRGGIIGRARQQTRLRQPAYVRDRVFESCADVADIAAQCDQCAIDADFMFAHLAGRPSCEPQ